MAVVRVPDAADIPVGQGRYVEAGGSGFTPFNAGGGCFYACGALCPHEDGPLSEGWMDADVAVCPWHGFDFDLRTGRCRVDDDFAIPVYAVRIHDGTVEVEIPG